jgi:16S rRNA (cytosine967-C5)-methyltransferase
VPRQAHSRDTRNAQLDARALAWDVLQRVEAGEFADALLGRIGDSGLERRDQALATRIVYGTLAWQGYLDHILAACSSRALSELEAPVRTLLRMALFQIVKLTRIPAFAVVDTAVELSKRHRRGSSRGLVNAVLRRAAREWRSVPLPPADTDRVAHLSVRLSHPSWLVELWMKELGPAETEAMLAADNEEAPTALRVNLMKATRTAMIDELRAAGYEAEATRWSPCGLQIRPGGPPSSIPGYGQGLVSLQGEASQLVGLMVAPRRGDRILDACAAPGGKATHLAELMNDTGRIIALDLNPAGVRRIETMSRRLELKAVEAVRADATSWEARGDEAAMDCVLVDAPCTGLGTLRGHPEIRWRRAPADVARAAALQRRILACAARCVRPGGTLVYATCTLTRAENDAVVAAFLEESPEFEVDDPRPWLPAGAGDLIGADSFLRTLPSRHGLDGFFAARLKRRARKGIVRP